MTPRHRPQIGPADANFDFGAYLQAVNTPHEAMPFAAGATVFAQGDDATTVCYLSDGAIKLSVLSRIGKEAVVAMLAPGDFFGESVLAGQAARVVTATAMLPSTVFSIETDVMAALLHAEPDFSDRFIRHMLDRNIRVEADLVDQLFNSTERRLARTLLLLARYGEANPHATLPHVSQEVLAEMIGSTRTRVNFFMNKFRRLGYIEYNGGIKINVALLKIVLHD